MLKKEYEILFQFAKRPWEKFTFKEIKKMSAKKSESYVYNTLKRFAKDKILKEEKAGNVVLYSLALEHPKTQAYLGFVSEYVAWNQPHIPYKEMDEISVKVPTHFYALIITGSYASKTHKKNSDVDLVIIIEDAVEPKKVCAELSHYCEMAIPTIHLHVFKESEFVGMLLSKSSNYGKEIAKNNLLLFGAEHYYKMIAEAVKNGFNG